MKAFLKNFRQSPRKVRLVAEFVKGKTVAEAGSLLNLLSKKSSEPMLALIKSAVANAKENSGLSASGLKIKDIKVDSGIVMTKYHPGAHGRAYPLRKRTSHVTVELEEINKKVKTKNVS